MNIQEFYRDVMHVSDYAILQKLEEYSQSFSVGKGDIVIRQGEKQKDFLFLVSGIFRGYYLDAAGKDVTDCFGFKKGTPCMSVAVNNGISPINIEAVTPCIFLKISSTKLMPLIDSNPLLLKIYNSILQEAMQVHWDLKITVTQRNAMQRYQWFIENYASIIDHVNNKDIASYLGMTPVTLIRIRKTMRDRK